MRAKMTKKDSLLGDKLRRLRMRRASAWIAAACGVVAVSALAGLWSAQAQQPFGEPYPQPGTQAPPPNYERAYPPGGGQGRPASSQDLRCAQLEHELANEWVTRQQGQDNGVRLEAEIRKYDRIFQQSQAQAEQQGCYRSNFIFGRSLVRTPRCMRIADRIEDARRRLEALNAQRQASRGGNSRRRDDLVAALARAGCGTQYQQQTRRSSGGGFLSWLEEDFWDTRPRQGLQTSRIEQFATYRTLCVRSCDGYYFPISFSTLPSNFGQDVQKCQSQCAAPAELFVYRNPGEEPEQMVSSDGQRAYSDLANAWRYRKEFVKGCSCKTAEYDPNEIALANEKAGAEKSQNAPAGPGGAQFADDKNKPKQTQ